MKRLMKYYVISDRTVEEQATLLSPSSNRKKTRGIRRAGTSSLKKIKANERSSVRRLAREIGCNFQTGDGFISCKYDDEHYPGSKNPADNVPGTEWFEKAEDNLTKFWRKLRGQYKKRTGKTLKGFWQTANWSPKRQAPARLHHHLIVPSDAVEIVREIWPLFGGAGTVRVEDLDSDNDRTRLAEYMVSNVSGKLPGMKGWSGSRGMEQPVLSEPKEISSVEEIQLPAGAVIKAVREITDEDGIVIGKYLRYVLPEKPRMRGGQIIMPRPKKRGGHKRE